MTRDGALVITHDSSLERTTDGTGTVEEKTEAEIRRLRTKQGNKVLFLDELLDAADAGGITLSYEEKQAVEGKKRKQLVKVVKRYAFSEVKYTKEYLDFK